MPERTVLLTRTFGANDGLATLLRARGIATVELPCVRVEHLADGAALAAAVRSLGEGDWLALTSAAALDAVLRAVTPAEIRCRVAAVGRATAVRCAEHGLTAWMPTSPDGATLGRELPHDDGLVLWPRADRAEAGLRRELLRRGARVRDVDAYRTVAEPSGDIAGVRRRIEAGEIDGAVLYSPTSVDGLLAAVPAAQIRRIALVAIGPTTAQRVRERAGVAPLVAASPALDDVAAATSRALEISRAEVST